MLAAMDLLFAPAMYANVVQLMNGVEPQTTASLVLNVFIFS
jgi:hypothetical protein